MRDKKKILCMVTRRSNRKFCFVVGLAECLEIISPNGSLGNQVCLLIRKDVNFHIEQVLAHFTTLTFT